MKKMVFGVLTALALGVLAGCSGQSTANTTAANTEAVSQEAADSTGKADAAEDADTAEKADAAGAAGAAEDAADSQEAGEIAADNPFNGKTVKVGCSATFVPFESIEMDAKGNKIYVGMNIDIVKAVVEKNGGTVEFQDMPFKSLTAAIQANQIDFCSGGMAPTEERAKTLDFSEIFFYPRNAIVYREGDSYPTLDSLAGKTVAYVFGTNYQQVAESIEGVNAVGIQGSPACIEEVKSKRADACIVDGAGAVEFLKQNTGLTMSLLDKVEDDCFAIGFPKGSPYYETFNNTLKEMMENGELDEIIASHLSEEFIAD